MEETLSPIQQSRITRKMEEVKRGLGADIVALFQELNASRLNGKGRVTASPVVDRNSLQWALAWKQDRISYDMSVIVRFDDDGKGTRVASVWVHRHASAPMEFDGHTPTTRMHRVSHLTITNIRDAIEAEW